VSIAAPSGPARCAAPDEVGYFSHGVGAAGRVVEALHNRLPDLLVVHVATSLYALDPTGGVFTRGDELGLLFRFQAAPQSKCPMLSGDGVVSGGLFEETTRSCNGSNVEDNGDSGRCKVALPAGVFAAHGGSSRGLDERGLDCRRREVRSAATYSCIRRKGGGAIAAKRAARIATRRRRGRSSAKAIRQLLGVERRPRRGIERLLRWLRQTIWRLLRRSRRLLTRHRLLLRLRDAGAKLLGLDLYIVVTPRDLRGECRRCLVDEAGEGFGSSTTSSGGVVAKTSVSVDMVRVAPQVTYALSAQAALRVNTLVPFAISGGFLGKLRCRRRDNGTRTTTAFLVQRRRAKITSQDILVGSVTCPTGLV
jgi:hypothetical protein